jgi:biotin-(acetyl-CoA carboxylase) ligase
MDYDITSADMAEQALSQAVDEHIENSKEVIEHIENLEKRIRTWNMEDIREFKVMVIEMRALLMKHFQVQIDNFMNMNLIPTQRVPDILRKTYHIVGVDKKGYALYGPEMDKIASVQKISDHYNQCIVAKKQAEQTKK